MTVINGDGGGMGLQDRDWYQKAIDEKKRNLENRRNALPPVQTKPEIRPWLRPMGQRTFTRFEDNDTTTPKKGPPDLSLFSLFVMFVLFSLLAMVFAVVLKFLRS